MREGVESAWIRLLLVLMGFSALSITLSGIYGDSGYFRYKGLSNYRDKLLTEIGKIEEEIAELELESRELEDWGFRAEKIAREEFGLAYPGEIVIYFSEDEYCGYGVKHDE